ncbi:MAG TPA: 30S ribosome-binding factor RbfA [Longimicrobiales bacterium]
MSRRVPRLNEQLKREITDILRSEVKDPRIGFVTVTDVRVSADLSVARVYVSVMGGPREKEETLEGLRAAAPFIRGEIGRRMRIRRAPELRFELDVTLERAMRIEQLLREVRGQGGNREGADGDEE